MLKNFVLYDGNLDNRQVGVFSYDAEKKQFAMSIDNSISIDDLPLSLEILVHKGNYQVGHDDALRWVRGRICPPGRHNINEILSGINLKEYDEFELIAATGAKCDKDEVYMLEIDG